MKEGSTLRYSLRTVKGPERFALIIYHLEFFTDDAGRFAKREPHQHFLIRSIGCTILK